MERFVTSVYQCRVCGSIISSSEGVERHGENCSINKPHRLVDNGSNPKSMEQMAMVDFPCPIILLDKIPTPIENEDIASKESVNDRKALRLRPRYNKFWKADDDDNDGDDTSDGSEFGNHGDGGADDEITSKRRKIRKKRPCVKPDNPFACPIKGCDSRLKNKIQLKLHFITHLENNPYACPIPGCDQKLSAQYYFKRHIDWHMGKNLISCPKCGRTLSRTDNLKKHKCPSKRKRTKGPYSAFGKDKITQSEEEVMSYLRSHFAKLKEKGFMFGDPPQDGSELDWDFKRNIDINTIIKTDSIFLRVCRENPSFEDLIFWPDYKEQNYRNIPPQYKCESCNFAARKLSTLKDHCSLKHDHRPWRCLKCGRTFKTEMYLTDHMKFHETTKNTIYVKQLENLKYECTKCGFQSKFEVSVRRHWRLMHNVTVPNQMNAVLNEGKDLPKKKRTRRPSAKGKQVKVKGHLQLENLPNTKKEMPPPKFSTVISKKEYEIQDSLNNCMDKMIGESIDVTEVKAVLVPETLSEMIPTVCEGYDSSDMLIKSENHPNGILMNGDEGEDFCDLLKVKVKSECAI